MKTGLGAMLLVLLAARPVRSAEPAGTHPAGPVPEGTIEFDDDEVDFGSDLPPDAQRAEYLKTILAMTPRVHNAIRSQAVSPDGRRVVYVVARDAGATTAESLHAFMGVPVPKRSSTRTCSATGSSRAGERPRACASNGQTTRIWSSTQTARPPS